MLNGSTITNTEHHRSSNQVTQTEEVMDSRSINTSPYHNTKSGTYRAEGGEYLMQQNAHSDYNIFNHQAARMNSNSQMTGESLRYSQRRSD